MTLAALAEHIASKTGKSDAESLVKIKGFIRRRYETIYNSALWREATVLRTQTAAAAELTLPHVIERVVAVRWDGRTLAPVEPQLLFAVDPQIFERTGEPCAFSHLAPSAVATAPAGETLSLVSDSAADTQRVLIRGELAGEERTESVTLNGTTPVVTAKSYDFVSTFSKEATTGEVTVSGGAGVLLKLWAEEGERKHARLRLHEGPQDATKALLVLGKRRLRQLTDDLDTPLLTNIDNPLIAFAMADELERQRQYAKAQAKLQEGATHMQILKDQERNQTGIVSRIVPAVEGAWDADDCWME